ncbi:phage antirepressor [Dubosiella newyorkensis]|uniref:phage antirepressor n=1 Tax=Dubosiella newyorkensis TaxID=1862672 RepID=UPI0023F10822|nr:phage antirepressor KilAC domain-containing protein [Dubosiella newyorkensis]
MNELQIFKNDEFGQVRTTIINDEPYFVGKDVAVVLGYRDTSDALKKHVDEEDKGVCEMPTPGGRQQMKMVNESGLYSLIIGSKLPTAKRFKRWVTSEVLPTIRKHGAYAVDDLLDDPDLAIKAFTALKEERAKRKALEAQNTKMLPKAVFADAVTTSDSCILIGDLAKLLRQNGVEIGQKRLFEYLRSNGFLIKRRGADWNSPTQRAMEMGLFEIKETAITHSDGHVTISKTTKVTGKGQVYFVNRFLGEVVE